MSKFGTDEGYIECECKECGRVRVVHYSGGVDICEKCRWCPQLGSFVTDEEFYEDDFVDEDWFGKPYEKGEKDESSEIQ